MVKGKKGEDEDREGNGWMRPVGTSRERDTGITDWQSELEDREKWKGRVKDLGSSNSLQCVIVRKKQKWFH